MSTAADIIETLRPLDIAACTLQYGYAVARDGKRVMFSPCARVVSTRRDKSGRCLMMLCEYADGSAIRFTYSHNERAEYRDATPKVARAGFSEGIYRGMTAYPSNNQAPN